MRIVCWQTILMKYHTLFLLKTRGMSQKLLSAAVTIGALRVNRSFFAYNIKPVLSGHSKKGRLVIGFNDQLSLNADQKYCRMLQESILQYFQHSLSYYLSFRPLFCLFLSGHLRWVLLYAAISTKILCDGPDVTFLKLTWAFS